MGQKISHLLVQRNTRQDKAKTCEDEQDALRRIKDEANLSRAKTNLRRAKTKKRIKVIIRAVLIGRLFSKYSSWKKAGKTGNIFKVWKFNRGPNIWKASHSNIWEKILENVEIQKLREVSPSIRTALIHTSWSIFCGLRPS